MKYRHLPYHIKRRIVIGISLAILASFYAFKNYSIPFRAFASVSFIICFYLVDHLFDLKFKHHHYFFAIAMAVIGILLSPLYYIYPSYDKLQHLILPIMVSSMIFHTMSGLSLKLKWKITFTFFIVLGVLGLFEIGEYLLDLLFDFKLQGVFLRDIQGIAKFKILQDKIDDTMIDMILGTIGTALYSIIALIRKRKR